MPITINGTTGVSGVDGSAATPALIGTDTNTGIFFPAADTIAFSEGGVESMRIDSSGNVGIGTSSPVGGLHINTVTRTLNLAAIASGGGGASYIMMGNNDSGGVAGPNVIFSANRSLVFGVGNSFSSAAGGTVSEYMRIDATGRVMVAANSIRGDGRLAVKGIAGTYASFSCDVESTASHGQIQFSNPNGQVGAINTSGTATAYVTSSDYRLKENVQPMQGALDTIARLNPVTYTWKVDGSDGQGFIAHELQEVFPDAVTGEKDAVDGEGNPKYQGVDSSFLVPTLAAAIKEQQQMIKALQAEVAALKGV